MDNRGAESPLTVPALRPTIHAMRGFVALASLLLSAGCSLRSVNNVALGGSLATIACDWGQTRRLASQDWPRMSFEKNEILGAHPSAGEVDIYFAGYMVAAAVLWKLTPRELRWATSTMIIGMQTSAILDNHAVARQLGDESMCGDYFTDK